MIHVDLPAAMECTEPKCGARLSVKLALTLGGTFVVRPPGGHGWQIGANAQGVLVCRCPLHHLLVERVTHANGLAVAH